jgi:hypothetical protein
MDEAQIAIVTNALVEVQKSMHAAGIEYSIGKIEFIKDSDVASSNDEYGHAKVDHAKVVTLEVCCDLWDCRSGRCVCIRYKNC